MRIVRALSLLCLAPFAATAETITARTGWHDGFTRIVFATPENADWQIGRSSTGYVLRVEGATGAEFEGFFDRIPRDRVDAVAYENGLISIGMNCDCHATAFRWRADRLVLDIRDGPPPGDSPFEVSLTQSSDAAMAPDLGLVPRPVRRVALDDVTPLADLLEAEEPNLTEVERNIIAGLSRAVEQGLIEMGGNTLPTPVEDEPQAVEVSETPASVGDPIYTDLPAMSLLQPGLEAHTSIEAGIGLRPEDRNLSASGQACWPDTLVDVESWVGEGDFHAIIQPLRASIFSEFDRVDEGKVTQLARAYVAFGFGREALDIMNLDGANSRERSIIASLARLVEGQVQVDGALAAQVSCPGKAALWAALAGDEGQLANALDINAMIRQFRGLSEPLQRHLGPLFAERLLAAGNPDGAELVIEPGRFTALPETSVAILEADLSRARGDTEAALMALQSRALTDPRIPSDDLADLVDLAIESGAPLEPSVVDLVEARLFEERGSATAPILARAYLRGLGHIGAYGAMFAALQKHADTLSDAQYDEILAEGLQLTTNKAPDVTFLEIVFSDNFRSASPATTNAIAARLMTLGFPQRASEFLVTEARAGDMAERRYLRAQAAMALGDTGAAERALSGITTDRARAILTNEITIGETPGDIPDSAWRRSEWSELAQSDDPLLRAASQRALSVTRGAVQAEKPLAATRALLDDTGELRSTVLGLLDQFEGPAD